MALGVLGVAVGAGAGAPPPGAAPDLAGGAALVADPGSDAGTSRVNAGARSGAFGGLGPAATALEARGSSGGALVTGPPGLVSDGGSTGVGPGVPRGRPIGASTPRAHRPTTMTTGRAVSDRDRARTFRPR